MKSRATQADLISHRGGLQTVTHQARPNGNNVNRSPHRIGFQKMWLQGRGDERALFVQSNLWTDQALPVSAAAWGMLTYAF